MTAPEGALAWLPLLAHIETRLDEDLSLDELSRVAGVSKFHLQRVFASAVGASPRAYVEKARLERAAFHLGVRDASVLDIALDCGFKSHEVFVRAFRRRYRTTPTKWRATQLASRGRSTAISERLGAGSLSPTKLQEQRALSVAFIRHVGPYERVPMTLWAELAAWARRRGVPTGALLGIGHDAPGLVPAGELRFDACVVVPDGTTARAGGRVAIRTVAGGLFAVTTYVGPLAGLGAAYRVVFERLMARRDLDVIGLPVVERYRGTELIEGRLELIDLCLPVARASRRRR
jgi:AraC family transcriptional regulator